MSCERPYDTKTQSEIDSADTDKKVATTKTVKSIASEISFYVDNSGGMFGYVNKSGKGDNNFILALSDIAHNPLFPQDDVKKDFNLINGPDELVVTPLGSDASKFSGCLNPQCFNQGNISGNDLNAMLQLALEKAVDNKMSVFISDAIYDIQDKSNPLNDLRSAGFATRNHFIERLEKNNIQTLIIKLSSFFSGEYFYGATTGGTTIDQERPFYIFILGSNDQINRYFSNEYVQGLDGYRNHARFFLPKDYDIKFVVSSSYKKRGQFRPGMDKPTTLSDVESNRNGEFQFSVGVNYSNLPIAEDYLMDPSNYKVTQEYEVVGVDRADDGIFTGVTSIDPTHLITIRTKGLPYGSVKLSLQNKLPMWIDKTHIINDQDIEGDTTSTFGFKYLVQGIADAYDRVSQQNSFITTTFTVSRD
jgi:hypothetical protein